MCKFEVKYRGAKDRLNVLAHPSHITFHSMMEPLAAQRLSLPLSLFPDGVYVLFVKRARRRLSPKIVVQRGPSDGDEHSGCLLLEWLARAIPSLGKVIPPDPQAVR